MKSFIFTIGMLFIMLSLVKSDMACPCDVCPWMDMCSKTWISGSSHGRSRWNDRHRNWNDHHRNRNDRRRNRNDRNRDHHEHRQQNHQGHKGHMG